MAEFNQSKEQAFTSTNDLTGKQGYGIALDASNANSVVLGNAQTLPVIGILVDPGKGAGDTCRVSLFGETIDVISGGTITKGDRVTPNSSGSFITTTTPSDMVCGIAMESAVNGDRFKIMKLPGFFYHA